MSNVTKHQNDYSHLMFSTITANTTIIMLLLMSIRKLPAILFLLDYYVSGLAASRSLWKHQWLVDINPLALCSNMIQKRITSVKVLIMEYHGAAVT